MNVTDRQTDGYTIMQYWTKPNSANRFRRNTGMSMLLKTTRTARRKGWVAYDITRRQTKEATASERGHGDDAPPTDDRRRQSRRQTANSRNTPSLRLTTYDRHVVFHRRHMREATRTSGFRIKYVRALAGALGQKRRLIKFPAMHFT